MPPVFTQHLAARLNQLSALTVREAAGQERLEPGQVLIAPGNFHIEFSAKDLSSARCCSKTHRRIRAGRPSMYCFDRLPKRAAPNCLAVVLTGMGHDGMRGAEHIVRAGGAVFAQDEASSVVWGMPRAVVDGRSGTARALTQFRRL